MEKKKHILRNIIIAISSVVVLLLATIGILICDFTDNTPDYISEVKDQDIGTFMSNKVNESFDGLGLLDDYEFLFDEHELNDMLATIVPIIQIPMVKITSIYLSIDEEDNIKAEAPLWAAFYKSCAKVDGFLSYDKTTIKLNLTMIKINLLNSTHGIVDAILSEDLIKNIQTAINDAGVAITMEKVGTDIIGTMTNLDICKTIVDCTQGSSVGFLSAALVAGVLNANNVEIVVNQKGKTGVIIHRSLI